MEKTEETIGEGKYVLNKKAIGAGGFGSAFLVKRIEDNTEYIAKINREPHTNYLAEQESERLKKYKHKNIVGYVDNFKIM